MESGTAIMETTLHSGPGQYMFAFQTTKRFERQNLADAFDRGVQRETKFSARGR